VELGPYDVDAWLDRGPAHQLFRTPEGLLVYRLLPTAEPSERQVLRPTVELLVEALQDPRTAAPAFSAAHLDGDEMLIAVEDVHAHQTLTFGGPLAPVLALGLAHRLLDGLAALHGRGLYHGALTPSRIGLAADGAPVLFDVGAALLADADPEHRLAAALPGFTDLYPVPALIPPEIFHWKPLSPAADVFLVAALAYRWLTGRYAHGTGRAMEIYGRLRDGVRDPFPPLPAGLNVAAMGKLQDALSSDPEERPSPEELLESLRPFGGVGGSQLVELTAPASYYATTFSAMSPEDAPGPPGSANEIRRQEALRRATLQMEMVRAHRPEPKRARSWTWLVALLLVAAAAVALPDLMGRLSGSSRGGPGPAPAPVHAAHAPDPDGTAAEASPPSADAAPSAPKGEAPTPTPTSSVVTVHVGPRPDGKEVLDLRRRQPEPEAHATRRRALDGPPAVE